MNDGPVGTTIHIYNITLYSVTVKAAVPRHAVLLPSFANALQPWPLNVSLEYLASQSIRACVDPERDLRFGSSS
jgi:hypothetical protein